MGVSPTEKTVKNKDLTRATDKTWSQMQTVTMGWVSWMDGNRISFEGLEVRGNEE